MTSRRAVDLPKQAGAPVHECLDLERRKVVFALAEGPRTEADARVRERPESERPNVVSAPANGPRTEADAPAHECLDLERRKVVSALADGPGTEADAPVRARPEPERPNVVSAPADGRRTEADAPVGDWLDPERKAASEHVVGTQDTRVRGPVQGRAVLDRAARAPGEVAHGEGPPRRGREAQEGAARSAELRRVAVQAGGARPQGLAVTSAGGARRVGSVPAGGEAGSARSREVVVRADPAPGRAH
ncbi:MAG TPA: hypothetical protein VFD38_01200, partial [Myxococcaceae bacterium]|nr:hypothetical protein [Myxococcaceae bacterium]